MSILVSIKNTSKLIVMLIFTTVFVWPPTFAMSPSPEEVLETAKTGRVEFIKVLSDVGVKFETIPRKEELYPYFEILDPLSEIEKSYGLNDMGQSVVKTYAIALTRAAQKWLRLDVDRSEYVELFMKYGNDTSKVNFVNEQDKYLLPDASVAEVLVWVEKTGWLVDLSSKYKSDFFVVLACEDLQGNIVKKFLSNVGSATDEQIELVISKVTSIPALSEIDAYLHSISGSADTIDEVLRSLRLACIFDGSVKKNPRAPMSLQSAAASAINDAFQRLINLRGVVSDSEIRKAVDVLPSAIVTNLSSLLISLSDRLIYRDQLDFLLSFASALAERLDQLGMSQQLIAMDSVISKLKILKRINHKNFEGTYDVHFSANRRGILTILHTGGGRLAATMNMLSSDGVIELPFSVFYFEYDDATGEFQATTYPFDTTEAQLPSENNVDLFFKLDESTDCIVGKYGAPFLNDSFYGCLRQGVSTFDEVVSGPQVENLTSLWTGRCQRNTVQLRVSQIGRRLVANWIDRTAAFSIPLNYGLANPLAHSALLTSGETDVGRFFQARVRFLGNEQLEVEFIVGGRGVLCHTVFRQISR